MATVKIYLPHLSGYITGGNTLALILTKTSDASAVNGAGDLLAESGTSGWFSATVAESWDETLGAAVVDQDGGVPAYGRLDAGSTVVSDGAAVLDTAYRVKLDASQPDYAPIKIDQITSGTITPATREIDDTTPIRFVWPTAGETITVERSVNSGAFAAATGVVTFFRTEGTEHWYSLAYAADDRAVGVVRYKLDDGTITRYMTLQVAVAGLTSDTITDIADTVLLRDWTEIAGEVPSRSTLNALRHIRNKWALDGLAKTVYAEDDTTPAYTTTVTADVAGNITADTPD